MRRLPYAFLIVAVTFVVLLASAGVRAAPGVLIKPLEAEFGWDRAGISLAIAVSILAYGLGAPLSGGLIDRFGPKRVMLGGLVLIVGGLVPLALMTELWQLHLFWGVVTGIGTGAVTNVLGATVALRWFRTHRGIVLGAFAAASSAGQLIFIPTLQAVVLDSGWRTAIGGMAAVLGLTLLPVLVLMRDRPSDIGVEAYGATGDAAAEAADRAEAVRTTSIRDAARSRDFWLLAGSFFICGYTSNGLIGTHLIPHAVEHGFTEVTAAGAVALMGTMNIVGTLASGWLTDRYDNRRLLAAYYGFRALSIASLPFILEIPQLLLFAIVYGLDWIATVPPTANLTARIFGRGSLGTIYGWIFFSHMVGAALAAFLGGLFRDVYGDYHAIFISAALIGFVAVLMASRISNDGVGRPAEGLAAAPVA
ncbi:MAG TPA: MFS transporter [Candidatus Limnocylindrales bacterium]|nr:MFS transporter [Candidatus Limnocylindrales bacterium]